jgi:hypothetical protein
MATDAVGLDAESHTIHSLLYSAGMKTRAEPQVVTRYGKAISVILPIAEYEELLERAEDASDLKWLKRARAGKLQYRPLEEYLSERKSKTRA